MSILEQDYPKEYIEVFIIDGNSTDKTRDIVSRYTSEYSFIRLLDNPKRYVPYALNMGLEVALKWHQGKLSCDLTVIAPIRRTTSLNW